MGKPATVVEFLIHLRRCGDDRYYSQADLLRLLAKNDIVIPQATLSAILDVCLFIGVLEVSKKTSLFGRWKYRALL